MKTKKISPVGSNWEDVRKELFTPEEIAESDVRVAIIGELIKARRDTPVCGAGPMICLFWLSL
jgi:hypothetical protein